jgi:hypothetical protein
MATLSIKKFSAPDETRPFVEKGRAEILRMGDGVVGLGIFEPGWRWSQHLKPITGTDTCMASHTCYVLGGRMHIVMDSGEEADIGPGDVAIIPPGHDAWTVGEESCRVLDFSGMESYGLGARPPAARVQPEGAEARH